MEPSTAANPAPASVPPPRDDVSLSVAVAALVGDVRGLLSDAAEIVAAESQAALRRVVVGAVVALGAALLGGLSLIALLAALASELVSRGLSLAAALLCVAVLCAAGGMLLWSVVTRISRHASFASSRRLLRGNA
jgi:Putative Actinobacterial Holin-X, holin superfamily III